MRSDVVISVRRDQRTVLRRMAAQEDKTVTELINDALKLKLSEYPTHLRSYLTDGVTL